MIQIYSQTHERLCLLQGYTNLKIREKLENGDKELTFQYPRNGTQSAHLQCEHYVRTRDDEFVIKEISGGGKWRKYTAVLNLEELEGKSFADFETVGKTIRQCLTVAFDGTGWTVGTCQITKIRTIRKDSACTVLDIIEQCISTYNCEIEYHSLEKTVDIYAERGADKGVYFIEKLNLRKPPSFISSSTGLYTQIRPIGKDGLKIDVDGKDYLEDHTYSPKNIMYTWVDGRYTILSHLMEDARLKLNKLSTPVTTYEADIIDLAAVSAVHKDILKYDIGDYVTLISKTEGIKERMRIAVIDKYPETPQENTCQLSTAKRTFDDIHQDIIARAVAEATGAAAKNTESAVDDESQITSEEIALEIAAAKQEIFETIDEAYLSKADAESVTNAAAQSAAASAAAEAKSYADEQIEPLITSQKAAADIAAAKKDVLQTVAAQYATAEQLRNANLSFNAQIAATNENVAAAETRIDALEESVTAAETRIDTLEETKHQFVDVSGTVWQMGIDGAGLYIEELESEG